MTESGELLSYGVSAHSYCQ